MSVLRSFSGISDVMSVSMNPGAIAFTVTPRPLSSFAADLVSPMTPALLAA